jgi:hypothetical protein
MKILSVVVLLVAVQGTISLRGKDDTISNGLFETAQRQLMIDKAGGSVGLGGGGMGIMVC